jgi:hypothetical protein
MKNGTMMVAGLLAAQSALASGIAVITTCKPLVEEDKDPVIQLFESMSSAPGGPISRTSSLQIGDIGPLAGLDNGDYELGVKLTVVALQTPTGAMSSRFRFITLEPGQSGAKALEEALYLCRAQVQ